VGEQVGRTAARGRNLNGGAKTPSVPQQKGIESRKQGLKLSRSRILEQLHSVENLRYRKILEQALAELDAQIMRLN